MEQMEMLKKIWKVLAIIAIAAIVYFSFIGKDGNFTFDKPVLDDQTKAIRIL